MADLGEGPGGPAPPYFETKVRPEGLNFLKINLDMHDRKTPFQHRKIYTP